MFRFLQSSALAVGVFCSFNGFAQPYIPERNQLPPIQYRTAYPVETAAAVPGSPRLTGRSHVVYKAGRAELADSVHFWYTGANDRYPDGSPMCSGQINVNPGQGTPGSLDRRSFQTFTSDKKPAVYWQQRWDTASGSWINLCRESFVYHRGLLLRDTTWNWDERRGGWTPVAFADYLRDEAGNAVRVIIRSRNAATGRIDSAADLIYRFRNDGRVVACISRYGSGRLRLSGRQTITYNTSGAVDGSYHHTWDSVSSTWKADRGFRFVLGRRNERLVQEEVYWNSAVAEWMPAAASDAVTGYGARCEYEYDAAGRLTAMIFCRGTGAQKQTLDRYEYAYDVQGRRISAVHKLPGCPETEPGFEAIRFYYEAPVTGDASDRPAGNLRVWPVPADRQLNVDVSMFLGQEYRIAISDLQGRTLRTWNRGAASERTLQLALEGLPAGRYQLSLQSRDRKIYTARITVAG